MAIVPMQMKMVYRIGQSYGFELDRAHAGEFLATAGVGMASQFVEQIGIKLVSRIVGRGIVVIAPRDGGALQRNLSLFAGRQPSAVAVHDRNLGAGGLADRARLASFERVRGNLGGGLRHAIGIDYPAPKALLHALPEGWL